MKPDQRLTGAAREIDQHLRAIRQALRRPIEAEISRGGLTGPQRSVMETIVRSGEMSLKELSRQVGLAHSTVSGIVDRLEKRGLLLRTPDESDRRVSRIGPSKVVRDYVHQRLPALMVHPLVEALQRAKPTKRRTILEGLRILRDILEGAPATQAR